MEVILLQKLSPLGELGSLAKVKPGYARNYLIPQGKALPATRKNRVLFEKQREAFEKAQQDLLALGEQRIADLKALGRLEMVVKAGAEGKLFGAITANDIIEVLKTKGLSVRKQELRLPEKYLKQAGGVTVKFCPTEGKEAGQSCELDLLILGQGLEASA